MDTFFMAFCFTPFIFCGILLSNEEIIFIFLKKQEEAGALPYHF
jgi:hypothetical protein